MPTILSASAMAWFIGVAILLVLLDWAAGIGTSLLNGTFDHKLLPKQAETYFTYIGALLIVGVSQALLTAGLGHANVATDVVTGGASVSFYGLGATFIAKTVTDLYGKVSSIFSTPTK